MRTTPRERGREATRALDLVDPEPSPTSRRWLRRYDDHSVFAYARGHDMLRRSDHTLWAHFSNDVLLSARSGEPLAYAVGSILYDADTNTPVYYVVDT